MVKINGSSFPHQYRRTNPYPIDSTETWASIKEATEYARNTDAEPYMPYAGQVISIEGQEDIYVLVEDKAISKSEVENILSYIRFPLRKLQKESI